MTRRQSVPAYDLHIQGVWGEFNISSGNRASSVLYLQTYSAAGIDGSEEQKLSSELRPFREVFPVTELALNQLMQRDLDDNRVATEMIPYLLGDGKFSHRFFPPILACIVPIKGRAIEPLYLTRKDSEPEPIEGDLLYERLSTEYWDEDTMIRGFRFNRERRKQGSVWEHYTGASLDINTQRCRLVIIDGQHRAMALLALHRKFAGWPNDAKQYEFFYSDIVAEQEELKDINLPVCICFFPDLHAGNAAAQEVKDACRELFLVVNSQARPVTPSRNILLNDVSLSALFTRSVLSDLRTQNMHPANIVIDLPSERTRIGLHPLDVTSVMHVSNALEQLLFGSDADASTARFKASTQTSHDRRMARELRLKDQLGGKVDDYQKTEYPSESKDQILQIFDNTWGHGFARALSDFLPFKIVTEVTLSLQQLAGAADTPELTTARTVLFEGQGRRYVFESARTATGKKVKELEDAQAEVPQLLKTKHQFFKDVKKIITQNEKRFKAHRAAQLFGIEQGTLDKAIAAGDTGADDVVGISDSIYKKVTTSAFQTGLIMAAAKIKHRGESDFSWRNESGVPSVLLRAIVDLLNAFFSVHRADPGDWSGKTLKRARESRLQGFSGGTYRGLVSLLSNEEELDPKRWPIFSFVILEVVADQRDNLTQLDSISSVEFNAVVDAILKEFRGNLHSKLLSEELARRKLNFSEADWAKVKGAQEKEAMEQLANRIREAYQLTLSKVPPEVEALVTPNPDVDSEKVFAQAIAQSENEAREEQQEKADEYSEDEEREPVA